MTLAIHEAGGLLAPEIQLRIDEAAKEQVDRMDAKLKEHQAAIETRLERTDAAVSELRDRTSEMKADVAVLVASDATQTKLLETIVSNGDKWHEADIDFRAVLVQRVSAIEVETKRLRDQLDIIRWIVTTSSTLGRCLGIFGKLFATEEFWKVFGIALILYILHLVCPPLYHLAKSVLDQ